MSILLILQKLKFNMCKRLKSKSNYNNMTVNERLFVSGKINDFDKAVLDNDYNKAISILCSLSISEEEAYQIVDSVIHIK